MKIFFLIFTIAFISIFASAKAQRYRNKSNLGSEERVKFIALKNGDIVEFNWSINSTRAIKSIELRKRIVTADANDWVTVKKITNDEKKYIDYLPDLGIVQYKLILIDDNGMTSEYEPIFKLKKRGVAIL